MTEKSALRTMAEKSYGKVHGNLVRDPMLTNGGKVSIALNGGKVFGKFQRKIRFTHLYSEQSKKSKANIPVYGLEAQGNPIHAAKPGETVHCRRVLPERQ